MSELGTNKGRILIIEDDLTLAETIKDRLEFRGYDVRHAPDGKEGADLAHEWKPELIICDVLMPVKNGLQVCQELRSEGNNVPFIFLTAFGMSEDQVRGLECGADDYIIKPFDPRVLETKVSAFLKRSQGAS